MTSEINMDFDISPIWKGQHTFLKSAIFSPNQVFNGVGLKFVNQKKGDVVFFDGNEWKTLCIGKPGQTLIVNNNLPVWGYFDATKSIGVLKAENGGTGINNYTIGSMLFANTPTSLAPLNIGNNGQTLIVENNKPTWGDFPGIVGSGKSSYLAVWSSDKSVCSTDIQIDSGNLILKKKNSSIHIGRLSISEQDSNLKINYGKNTLLLNENKFSIQNGQNSVLEFDDGTLINGSIPADKIKGTIDVTQGGTGLFQVSEGDIFYASKKNKISTLSIENSNGFYLKAVNGRPQWAPIEQNPLLKTTNNTSLELSPGTQYRVPLKFSTGNLSTNPPCGAVEWDGKNVLVTNQDNQRKALLFEGDNLNALAKGVFEIIPINMGGTGANLANKPVGSFLFINSNLSFGVLNPKPNEFIKFDSNGTPSTSAVLLNIIGGNGVNAEARDGYSYGVSIDQTSLFNPIWEGKHIFKKGVVLGEDNVLELPKNINSGLPQIRFQKSKEPTHKQSGDMWFDEDLYVYANGASVNITSQSKQNIKTCHHLAIFSDINPTTNSVRNVKYPLPYSDDGISSVRWKIVRADLRIETAPTNSDAKLNIKINNKAILESDLTVQIHSNSVNTRKFILPYANSGDLISVEFGETGGGEHWSLYLTVVED